MSPDEVEDALAEAPLVLRGPDDRADGRTEHDRRVFAVCVTRPRRRVRVWETTPVARKADDAPALRVALGQPNVGPDRGLKADPWSEHPSVVDYRSKQSRAR